MTRRARIRWLKEKFEMSVAFGIHCEGDCQIAFSFRKDVNILATPGPSFVIFKIGPRGGVEMTVSQSDSWTRLPEPLLTKTIEQTIRVSGGRLPIDKVEDKDRLVELIDGVYLVEGKEARKAWLAELLRTHDRVIHAKVRAGRDAP